MKDVSNVGKCDSVTTGKCDSVTGQPVKFPLKKITFIYFTLFFVHLFVQNKFTYH